MCRKAARKGDIMIKLEELTVERFAKCFDMAILAPDTTEDAIRKGCRDAVAHHLAAFYTNPCWTKVVAEELAGSDVLVGVAISFPYGTLTTEMKMAEVDDAVKNGGQTLDMVINIGALKSGSVDMVANEMKLFVEKVHGYGLLAKIIIEVGLLTDEEIATATRLVCEAGADYVKTATGSTVLPDVHHLEIMKANMSGTTKMKLSGVPKTFVLSGCLRMIEMGVELIGTRSSCKIVDEYARYLEEKKEKGCCC